jgi:hypothetical protein
MTVTTFSAREANEGFGRTGRDGPSIRELLAQPDVEDFEFDPPRLANGLFRPWPGIGVPGNYWLIDSDYLLRKS